jgi:hypothetical protein
MGIEGLCIATYEQPAWLERIVEVLADFVVGAIARCIREVEIDVLLFGGEDVGYKNGSMITPASVRRFMFAS